MTCGSPTDRENAECSRGGGGRLCVGSVRHSSAASLLPLWRHGEPLPHLRLPVTTGVKCVGVVIGIDVCVCGESVHVYMHTFTSCAC